jgi:hypothetical protein
VENTTTTGCNAMKTNNKHKIIDLEPNRKKINFSG